MSSKGQRAGTALGWIVVSLIAALMLFALAAANV